MGSVKNYILSQVASGGLSEHQAKNLLVEIKELEQRGVREDIAIIGMCGRFAGADNLDEYWENLENNVIAIRALPRERLKDNLDYIKRFSYDQLEKAGLIAENEIGDVVFDRIGYLNDIDKFDHNFFGIPPREARAMECEQRLFLEAAYGAMEDAGYGGDKLSGSKTGVFVGMDHSGGSTYKKIAKADPMVVTGTWPGILSSRVSYVFDLKGPSVVIDTACSSGLVCVHEAIKSLRAGDCDMAIVGGVSSIEYNTLELEDDVHDLESVESKKKIVRTFDNGVDGTVWGEGVGAIILKGLKKAIADGDAIHAVIKGSAINNDGASNGITAPDAGQQERLLLDAWDSARINPESIQYIEAHGTGTKLGDSIEVKALTEAFGKTTGKKQFCAIGSVKSSMGHLVAASGIAGLVKVALMMKHKKIPATLNFTRPNRFIDFTSSPVYVNDRLTTWRKNDRAPRRAGISSFGFSGTNCHVILEEYSKESPFVKARPFDVFVLSAKNEKVLADYVNSYNDFLQKCDNDFASICFSAACDRGHYKHRIAIIAQDKEDLIKKLRTIISIGLDCDMPEYYYQQHKVVYQKSVDAPVHQITAEEKENLSQRCSELLGGFNHDNPRDTIKELCSLYVRGADIAWDNYFAGSGAVRVHVPTYPFERIRCWYEEDPEIITQRNAERRTCGNAKGKNIIGHPLVHQVLVKSLYNDVYSTWFDPDGLWVLKEHHILDYQVLPGTSYIEMTLEACKDYFEDGMEINNLSFFQPMVFEPSVKRECHILLDKCREDEIDVRIISKNDDETSEANFVKNAECTTRHIESGHRRTVDIDVIIRRLNEEGSASSMIHSKEELNPDGKGKVSLGPHWDLDKPIATGEREKLLEFFIPDELAQDFNSFNLHVSMLDEAINALISKVAPGLYLPYFYKTIRIFGKTPRKFYSHIKIKSDKDSNFETVLFDVDLIDMQGNVFLEVIDYATKRVHKNKAEFGASSAEALGYYKTSWKPYAAEKNSLRQTGGETLILGSGSRLCAALTVALKDSCKVISVLQGESYKKCGDTLFEIAPTADSYETLVEELRQWSINRIIYAPSLTEDDPSEVDSVSELSKAKQRGINSLFYLTKALVSKGVSDASLIILADNAFATTENPPALKPHNAALLAMGKVIQKEFPEFRCRAIDVDNATAADVLAAEINCVDTPYCVAYREGVRYAECFEEVAVTNESDGLVLKSGGVYLITGGLGRLGLAAARHLAKKEKVKLVLIGRSLFPGKMEWIDILSHGADKQKNIIKTLLEIEGLGSEAIIMQADVSSEDEMRAVIDTLQKDYGKVNGVLHCAGNAGVGMIITKDKKAFNDTIAPKMDGTLILANLLKDMQLDFFILYSSMVSLFADAGQSDYISANSYMDAYAVLLRQRGINAHAINWPAWNEAGMAVDFGVDDKRSFIKSLSNDEALTCLEKITNNSYAQVLPGRLNLAHFKVQRDSFGFLLSPEIRNKVDKTVVRKHSKAAEDSPAAPNHSSISVVGRTIEDVLSDVWCKVLGFEKVDIYDSFAKLGGDSLMAIQIIKVLDRLYPKVASVPDIFTYPSVAEMADYIRSKNLIETSEEVKSDEKSDQIASPDEDELSRMLDSVESGEASIDSVLGMLDK